MLEGEVHITLAGQPVTLSPTLGAAIRLNSLYGSLGALLGRLESYDMEAATETVLQGSGRTKSDSRRTTAEVFQAGLMDLTPYLIHFVILLVNGGKPVKHEEEEPKVNGPFDGSP